MSDALRKMSLMPAQRLQKRAPAFAKKGRLRVGFDADIVIFDPETVIDNSTYEEPTLPPTGMEHVIVGGVRIVDGGKVVQGVAPGKGIKAQR